MFDFLGILGINETMIFRRSCGLEAIHVRELGGLVRTSHTCRLAPAPRSMKIGVHRLAKEFELLWCREPDNKSDTGDLQASRIVAPLRWEHAEQYLES